MTIVVCASTAALLAWFFVRSDNHKKPDPKHLKTGIFPATVFLYALLLQTYFGIPSQQIIPIILSALGGYLLYLTYTTLTKRRNSQTTTPPPGNDIPEQ